MRRCRQNRVAAIADRLGDQASCATLDREEPAEAAGEQPLEEPREVAPPNHDAPFLLVSRSPGALFGGPTGWPEISIQVAESRNSRWDIHLGA